MFLSRRLYTRASSAPQPSAANRALDPVFPARSGRWSSAPLPGGVIGLGLVLALLASRLLRASNLRQPAAGEMLLFFVPAVMSLLDHREFIGLLGLKLLLVIVLGTALVMAGTAITIELCHRWMNRHAS